MASRGCGCACGHTYRGAQCKQGSSWGVDMTTSATWQHLQASAVHCALPAVRKGPRWRLVTAMSTAWARGELLVSCRTMPTAKELGICKALDNPPAHLSTKRALAPSQGTSPGAREQSSLCVTGTPCRPPRPSAASCGLTCNAKPGFEFGPAGLDEASVRHSITHNVSQATANPAALRCRLLGSSLAAAIN